MQRLKPAMFEYIAVTVKAIRTQFNTIRTVTIAKLTNLLDEASSIKEEFEYYCNQIYLLLNDINRAREESISHCKLLYF